MIGELQTTSQETGSLPRLNERDRRKGAGTDVEAPGPGCYLAIASGEEVVHLPLTGAVTRLGRSLSADVHLDHATVSRRHALVVLRDGAYLLLDDRSMNGTFLNGERIREAPLQDGDVVEVGAIALRFVDSRPSS